MFTQIFSTLMTNLKRESLPMPRPAGMRLSRAEAEAGRAEREDWADMSLSERLSRPEEYCALQRRRREALLSLILVTPTDKTVQLAADCIGRIIEESTWSENPRKKHFDDESHPEIDRQAAETAMLFAWTVVLLGEALDRLDTSITARMRSEVRRRFLRPTMIHDDYAFMQGGGECPMVIASDVLLAALLLEEDQSRLGRIVRPALRVLDEVCARHGRTLVPLRDAVSDISAISDLVRILSILTHEFVDLSGKLPTGDWLDEILFSWICDDWFNDPAGDGMHPEISGCDIFRIADTAQDDSLGRLGATLYHQKHAPSQTVTGCMMDQIYADRLEGAFGKPQRLRYAATRGNLLMSARIPGLYCSMHVGGGRGNAGDICLFAESQPILVDGGKACSVRSLPRLAGSDPLEKPTRPCIADFKRQPDREILSADITNAYPAACDLRSYQRTVLTLRKECAVRIVDAVDFAVPHDIVFRFVCAVSPTILSTAVRLGPVRMTWEGDFTAAQTPLGDGLTLLELTCSQPVRQAFFAFNFEASAE